MNEAYEAREALHKIRQLAAGPELAACCDSSLFAELCAALEGLSSLAADRPDEARARLITVVFETSLALAVAVMERDAGVVQAHVRYVIRLVNEFRQ